MVVKVAKKVSILETQVKNLKWHTEFYSFIF